VSNKQQLKNKALSNYKTNSKAIKNLSYQLKLNHLMEVSKIMKS